MGKRPARTEIVAAGAHHALGVAEAKPKADKKKRMHTDLKEDFDVQLDDRRYLDNKTAIVCVSRFPPRLAAVRMT